MLGDLVGDLELEILRADALVEFEGGAAPVVALDRALAREEGDQLVFADLQIAEIERCTPPFSRASASRAVYR